MKTVTVLNNQSLWDISVQEYGTVEAVFELAMANDMGVTDLLTAGQELLLPEVDKKIIKPEVVAYYRRNGLHPVSGVTDPDLNFDLKNYEDMRIDFEWGNSDPDHPDMTQIVSYGGETIKKYSLKIKLSDPDFIQSVQDPILLIDRHRRKGGRQGLTRLSGWKHPRAADWMGRVFELPLTATEQVLDFKQEYFFRSGNFPHPLGVNYNTNRNAGLTSYGWIDLAFRISYRQGGRQHITPHIGFIRMYGYVQTDINAKVISYALK